MNLQQQSKLEQMCGNTFMYNATLYTINDFQAIGEKVLIGTDIKTLAIPKDKIGDFLRDCLPTEKSLAKTNGSALSIPGVETNYFGEIAAGLMTSFREIQGSKDQKFLKEATDRAKTKVLISKAVTDVAKTVIAGQKAARGKD